MPDSTCKIVCPFCECMLIDKDGVVVAGANIPNDPHYLQCPNCLRKISLERLYWVTRGLKIYKTSDLRCPRCFKLFAAGEYSDRPQTIKCKNCGKFSVFLRIDDNNHEAIESPDQIEAKSVPIGIAT